MIEAGANPSIVYTRTRGIVAFLLVFGFGSLVSFAFNLNLIGAIFENMEISNTGGKWLTALLIGGGSAPAHEVVRYIENKKAKAKEEKAQAEAKTRQK